MHVLIINLPQATERLAFQIEQMQRLGLEYEIIQAVSIDDIDDITYNKQAMGWERPLRRTELACFMSHFKAWQKVLESDHQPMLILEDDALLSRHVPALLEMLEKRDDCDLVTLEVRGRKKLVGKAMPLKNGHALLPLYQDRTGAAAYILWPNGARILINKADVGSPGLADAFISSTYQLRSFQVEPAGTIQLDCCDFYGISHKLSTVSSIGAESRPKPINISIIIKICFVLRRLASQFRLGIRRTSKLGKSTNRKIAIHIDEF